MFLKLGWWYEAVEAEQSALGLGGGRGEWLVGGLRRARRHRHRYQLPERCLPQPNTLGDAQRERRNGDAYADPNPNGHGNRHANPNANAREYGHANTNPYGYTNTHQHSHTNANEYGYANSD